MNIEKTRLFGGPFDGGEEAGFTSPRIGRYGPDGIVHHYELVHVNDQGEAIFWYLGVLERELERQSPTRKPKPAAASFNVDGWM